jgi:hypothetical protein
LGFLRRNLKVLDRLLENPQRCRSLVSVTEYKNLLVCRELDRQQLEMIEQFTLG